MLTDAEREQVSTRRAEIWGRMSGILAAARDAGAEELTKSQARDYEQLEAELDEMSQILDEDWLKRMQHAKDGTHRDRFEARKKELERVLRPDPEVVVPFDSGGGRAAASKAVLTRSDSIKAWAQEKREIAPSFEASGVEGLSLGKICRGMVTGDWKGAEAEHRALSEGTLSQGGYFVPTPLALDIIDRARNETKVLEAGALTVPMTSETQKIARVSDDPDFGWRAENAVITESDMTIEAVEFRARAVAALVRASREVLMDASNIEEILQDAFAKSLAETIDKIALYGSGTAPEPRGLRNQSGVDINSQGTNGAAVASYDPFVDAVGDVWDRNFDPNAVIMAPRTERTLSKLKDTTNQPLRRPPVLDDLEWLKTNQVPTNRTHGTATNASDAFVGEWRNLLIGVRLQLEIQVLQERYADALQVGFIAWGRYDVQLAHPEAFTIITGIIP